MRLVVQMDDLPTDHDVIVIGTGMPESIVAAAVSRIGQRVLHLDKEAHYGGLWASYNFSSLREWMFMQNESRPPGSQEDFALGPGESLMLTAENPTSVLNAKEIVNVPEKIVECSAPEPALAQLHVENSDQGPSHLASAESSTDELAASCPCPYSASAEHSSSAGGDIVNDGPLESEDVYHTVASARSSVDATYGSMTQHTERSTLDGLNEEEQVASGREDGPDKGKKELWSLEKLLSVSRKFNLDLAPKLLFSRGPLVELLISSNIARYAEFKAVTRILTMHNGTLQQVPCSRADVFSCKDVTVVEKRMLMKFLTFCRGFEQHPEEYRGFEGRPFLEFLQSRQLSKNVEHYVLHAIAMVDGTTPTLQALKSVQKFLESLGRYGNSPFLASLYGSGELPQCFCRLCAVYGGIYHLQRGPSALLLNEDGACIGIVSNGRRFNCRWVIMGANYAPPEMSSPRHTPRVSRAIVVADGSLHPADKEQITLLRLQQCDQLPQSVLVQEQGPGMMVCPPGLYVVHLTCSSVAETAEQDLEPAVKMLFDTSPEGEGMSKPKALYILYFNVEDTTQAPLNENCPPGLILVSSPGPHLDYEHTVNEAREIFHRMYPNEEFLPRAPDPEEILLEHENNPGDHGPLTEEVEEDPSKAEEKKGGEPERGTGDDASKCVQATSSPGDGANSSGDA